MMSSLVRRAYSSLYSSMIQTPKHQTWVWKEVNKLQARMQARRLSTDLSGAFTDRIMLQVFGGRGGTGCLSFARGPNQEIAPPDGGNGGNGGSIWIEADMQCRSLRQPTTHVHGPAGGRGMPAKRRGRDGEDVVIRVPPGTVIWELSPGAEAPNVEEVVETEIIAGNVAYVEHETTKSDPCVEVKAAKTHDDMMKLLVCELDMQGQRALIAAGGRGGRGNAAYKNSTNRTPMEFDEGTPGEARRLELELKTIADVGLVGFPNAGKSTLLRAVSRAKPRVAAYPFTTLRPHIGMVAPPTSSSSPSRSTMAPAEDISNDKSDGDAEHHQSMHAHTRSISVADIPGLVEGAHEDRGLGHDFLRHVERTTFLVYVIDVAQGGQHACHTLTVLQQELELYLPGLSKRASCVVANKMDAGENAQRGLAKLIDAVGDQIGVFPMSAKFGKGVEDVVEHLFDHVIRD